MEVITQMISSSSPPALDAGGAQAQEESNQARLHIIYYI